MRDTASQEDRATSHRSAKPPVDSGVSTSTTIRLRWGPEPVHQGTSGGGCPTGDSAINNECSVVGVGRGASRRAGERWPWSHCPRESADSIPQASAVANDLNRQSRGDFARCASRNLPVVRLSDEERLLSAIGRPERPSTTPSNGLVE
jgi:hypothetical protein